ncbi:MAG: PAS domain S-box protein [Opitutae bacterium]|nr:PAS domain S-box protein [Opitutae bacterium]
MKRFLVLLMRNGVRMQLILAVAGVHALLMSLFVWDAVTRQRAMLRQMQAEQAAAVSQSMATASAGWVAAHDVAGLQEIVEAQRRYPELVFAMVLDSDGLVLAHSDRGRLGYYVRDLPSTPSYTVLARGSELIDAVAPVEIAGRHIGWVRVGLGQRVADAQVAQITRDGMFYASAAIAVGILLAALMGTSLTVRLRQMRRVSEAVSAGRREARVPNLGGDEIGTLAKDFNLMLDRLAERDAEIRLKSAALDAAVNSVVITDRDGCAQWANPAFTAMTGYSREEVIGHDLGELVRSGRQNAEFYRQMWETILAGRTWSGELVNRRKDGSLFSEEMTIAPLITERGEITHFIAIKQDISSRRANEEALRASEERFRQVVETITQVFWVTDAQRTRMLYISPGYEKIWGRPREALYRSIKIWMDAIHPDDRGRFTDLAALQRRGAYDETFRIVRPDGSERWIRSRAFPVRGADGEVNRIVGVAEDVTDAKRIEEQFLRAQRLEAVGTLASGIAHDLNNILSPIFLVTGLLRSSLHEIRDLEMLQMIEKSAHRGAAVIRQLLTFSRGAPGERVVLQLPHLVKEMAHIASETFPRNIEVTQNILPGIWCVRADPTQLHQVLMNLCVNARDAMPNGGRLTLAVRNLFVAPDSPPRDPPLAPGPYVVLAVGDTGIGIPESIRHRIFDPFFTTKGVGAGTGLGLSTALGIVKGHGGALGVESAPGNGTTFSMYLPAEPTAESCTENLSADVSARGVGQLILVVDDEAHVRDTLKTLLERHGYRVVTAANGHDAMLKINPRAEGLRAVVTDIMMPAMDGVALIRVLRKIAPNVKVIATSGLGRTVRQDELKALGVDDVLAKPFEPEALLRLLEHQLARV